MNTYTNVNDKLPMEGFPVLAYDETQKQYAVVELGIFKDKPYWTYVNRLLVSRLHGDYELEVKWWKYIDQIPEGEL
jgi:hypothetical protein